MSLSDLEDHPASSFDLLSHFIISLLSAVGTFNQIFFLTRNLLAAFKAHHCVWTMHIHVQSHDQEFGHCVVLSHLFWVVFLFCFFLSLTCMCPSPYSTSFLSPAMSSFSHTDLLQMPSNNSIRKQIETLQVSCLASVACAALPPPFSASCPDGRLVQLMFARLGNCAVAALPLVTMKLSWCVSLEKRTLWCCHEISCSRLLQ